MTTLAEHIIVARAENRPPILEKSMYDSWASRIRLFIKGKKHGRMILDSIDNGPLVYPTVEENGQTRLVKYSELTKAQQLQDDCDVQATNIILHGLLPDVYALVNHQEAAKDIWDTVKLLMKGTELSYQERECRLYNLFNKFAYVQGDTLYEYYWRLSRLINDMHTIGMKMQQVQVYTKFLNALPSEWSKFVTKVKLAKSLYTTNYNQLYAYLNQHERHANEVRITRERYPDPLALVANSPTLYNPSQLPQHSGNRGIATTSKGNFTAGQPRVVKCYNCQGEGHNARQCTQPKKARNATWFKEKLMLAKAQEAGQILDEEQLAFLADPGISEASVAQQTIPHNSAFQTEDLDAYDSDCDNLSLAKAILMANLSSCDPEVLSEIHSDSNTIMYSQYLQESRDAVIQDINSSAPNDLLVLSLVEQMTYHVAHLEHAVIYVTDDEETLIFEEESRLKMLDKQNDPISIEKKIKISLIDYSKLNKIKEDFVKCFVTQKELSTEQAFLLKHLSFSETPITSHTLVRIEAPSELPKVTLVNESLKKIKYQLAYFDNVVKKRTTSDAITVGA
ncbi:copia protein [Tanacetum coccineum]